MFSHLRNLINCLVVYTKYMVVDSTVDCDNCFVCLSIGRPKHVRVMAGALEGDIFLGPKAEVGLSTATLLCWYGLVLTHCNVCHTARSAGRTLQSVLMF